MQMGWCETSLIRQIECHPSSDLAALGHLLPQGEKDE